MAKPAAAHGRWLQREAGRAGVDLPVPVLPGEKPYAMQLPILSSYTEGPKDAQRPVVLLEHETLPKFSASALNIRFRRSNTEEQWATRTVDPQDEKVKIRDLDEGTEYEFQTQIVTSRGTFSAWTETVLLTTAKDPFAPEKPEDVRYQGFEPTYGHVSQAKTTWRKPVEKDYKRTRIQVRFDTGEWPAEEFYVSEAFCYPAEYLYYINNAFPGETESFWIRLTHEDFSGNLSDTFEDGPYNMLGYALSAAGGDVLDAVSRLLYGPRFTPRTPPGNSDPYDPDDPNGGEDPGGSGTDGGGGLGSFPGGNGVFPAPDAARWIADPSYNPAAANSYDKPFVNHIYAQVKRQRELSVSASLYKTHPDGEPRRAVWSMSKHRIGRDAASYLFYLTMFQIVSGSPLAVEEAADFLDIMRRQMNSHPRINGFLDFCSDQGQDGAQAWNDKEDVLVLYTLVLSAYLLWNNRTTYPQHQGIMNWALDWVETQFVPKWKVKNRDPGPYERTMHPRVYAACCYTMLFRMTGQQKWQTRVDQILADLINEFRTTTAGGTEPRFVWRFGAVPGDDQGQNKNPAGSRTAEHMGTYPATVMQGVMTLAMLGTPGFSDMTVLRKFGATFEHCAVPGSYTASTGKQTDFYWWKGVGGPSLSKFKEHSEWASKSDAERTYTVEGYVFSMNDPHLYNSYRSFNWLCTEGAPLFMPFTSQAHADGIIKRYRNANGDITVKLIGPAVGAIARRFAQTVQPTGGGSGTPEQLSDAPPTLSNPTNVTPPSFGVLNLDVTKDYRVNLGSTPYAQALTLSGGRNIVLIGGEINIPNQGDNPSIASRTGLKIKNSTGTVHIEGLLIRGDDLSEGIQLECKQAHVRLQNIRVENMHARDQVGFSDNHPDLVQPYGGYASLKVDGFTASTPYQGVFLKPDNNTGPLGPTVLKRVNIKGDPTANYGALWLENRAGWGSLTLDQFFYKVPSAKTLGKSVWPDVDNPANAVSDRAVITTVGGVQRASWPQMTEPVVTGYVSAGDPPGGDFVKQNTAGVNYTSPGYL